MSASTDLMHFKPHKQQSKIITLRIDDVLLSKLDIVSISFDISRNDLISQCIDYSLRLIETQQINSGN